VLATPLINFTATAVQGKTQLSWKTTNEINTGYFEIQRSTNGVNFVTAGKVKAVNNGMRNSYSFTDALPADGKNYYRLKEVDISGSYVYSSIVFVQLNSNNSFRIYPTLVTDHLHITATQTPANVIIYNATGKPVKTVNLNTAESDINVSSLPAGTYIIRNTISNSSLKFIKQ
ncbi:MAG TPA: T9SS type A sorting domain-containing protein, partial [Chitinophagaceae bacterium]